MDAAQLVEQRKAGIITQEQFFIALNLLRRANSGLDNKPCSTAPAPAPSTDRTDGEKFIAREKLDGPGSESVGAATINNTANDRASGYGPQKGAVKIAGSIGRSAAGGDHARQSSEPLPPGQQQSSTAEETVNKLDGSAPMGAISGELEDSPCKAQLSVELNSSNIGLKIPHEFSRLISPTASRSGTGNRPQLQSRRDTEDKANRDDDSHWLISPNGETSQSHRRRMRKTPESRTAYNRDGRVDDRDRTMSAARLSPSRSSNRGKAERRSAKQPWRPAGGSGEKGLYLQSNIPRSQSPPATSSRPPSTGLGATGAVAAEGTPGEQENKQRNSSICDNLYSRQTYHQQVHQQPSLVNLPLETLKRRVADRNSGRRRRQSTQEPIISSAASDSVERNTFLGAQSGARTGGSVVDFGGDDIGVRSLPPGILWRRRPRNRGEDELTRRSRRLSSSPSLGSLDSNRFCTVATRDRFGYPLHERECLGSSGAVGRNTLVFSPMIKGLPDFYHARPNRTSDPFQQRFKFSKTAEVDQSRPLYERATDWLAKAGELRYTIPATPPRDALQHTAATLSAAACFTHLRLLKRVSSAAIPRGHRTNISY